MRSVWVCGLAFGAVALCVLTAASQPPDGKDRRERPPRGGPDGPPPPPPRFELGRVLPPFAREELRLTEEQEEEIARLEREVKERLSKILTAEQKKRLENLRPPRPGGPPRGGPGGPPDGDRPERQGRPPEGDRPERPRRPPDGRDRPERPRRPPEGDRPGRPPEGDRPERPGRPERDEDRQDQAKADPAGGIQWFATWEGGLREARQSGRPILLVSAAPHCAGVSGIW